MFYAQGTPQTGGIYLGSLDSPEAKRLTAAETAGAYAPPGWLMYVRQGTLVARRVDVARGALRGDEVKLADSVEFNGGVNVGAFSLSTAGLVAYRSGGANRRQLVWFDRTGKWRGTVGEPDENTLNNPRISPDGRQVAVWRVVEGNADIWLLDEAGATRFTVDASLDRYPIWSPNGRRIVFDSNRKGHDDLYEKPSSGAGTEELLAESPQDKAPLDWSLDGRFVLFRSHDPQTGYDLWIQPMEADHPLSRSASSGSTVSPVPAERRKPFVFLKTSFDERQGQFSPDGRWVAYTSNESGRHEIYVRPFLGSGEHWKVSTAGGLQPRWSSDGRELYYIAPDARLMAAPITVNGATVEPGTPVALFQTRIYGGGDPDLGIGWGYDVARDGRFLINVTAGEAIASPITVILNWQSALGAREKR
jgi:dipeptidyl aminopeptidase/acylaminoacyl peptidase